MNKNAFVGLLEKYMAGKASQAEKELLERYYEKLKAKGRTELPSTEEDELQSRILKSIQAKMEEHSRTTVPVRRRKWMGIAAVSLVFGIAALAFWLNKPPAPEMQRAAIEKRGQTIAPGGNHAFLTLADGQTIALETIKEGILENIVDVRAIKPVEGELEYRPVPGTGSKATSVTYNTLSTPRGGQYKVTLSDGTQVWLNAASSIRYPIAFNGPFREVVLQGEAYFEVAKNERMPFIIKVLDEGSGDPTEVKVLGTHFSIKAYPDEPGIRTTLVEGLVQVSKGKEKALLHPGQQAQTEREGIHVVQLPDVSVAIAWTQGLFQFRDANLKSILKQLERWYNVKVNYNDIPELHFSGTISRNTFLAEVLDMLEVTSSVKFEIKQGELTVKSDK